MSGLELGELKINKNSRAHKDPSEYGFSLKELKNLEEYIESNPTGKGLSSENIKLIRLAQKVAAESLVNYSALEEQLTALSDEYISAFVDGTMGMLKKGNDQFSEVAQENSTLKDGKRKGGSYSPNRSDENTIITLIDTYRKSQSSLGKKQTLQQLTEAIGLTTGLRTNLDTVKKWWANYKSSEGKTIFKQV